MKGYPDGGVSMDIWISRYPWITDKGISEYPEG